MKYIIFLLSYIVFTLYKFFIERPFLERIYGVGELDFDNTNDYLLLEKVSNIERATAIILIMSTILVFIISGARYLASKENVYLVGLTISIIISFIILYGLIPFWNGIM